MAASLYTIPISVTLIVGHGVVICILRREALIRWGISALLAIGLAAALYNPAFAAMAKYLAEHHEPSLPYSRLFPATLVSLLRGYNAPTNPVMRWGLCMLAVALLALGTAHCVRKRLLLPQVISLAVASLIAAIVPLLIPSAGEARFLIWLAPWFCIAAAAPLSAGLEKGSLSSVWVARTQGAFLLIVFAAPLGFLWMIPAQPVRDGIHLARQEAKRSGGPVIGVYMATAEARVVYDGIEAMAYELPD